MDKIHANKTGYGLLLEYDDCIPQKETSRFINEIKDNWSNPNKFDLANPKLIAVLQKYGIKNRNGRVYPEAVLKREVDKYQEMIKLGCSVGEKSHPESSTIETANIAILITKTWWEGATLMGEIMLPLSKGFVNDGIISCPADNVANLIMNGVLLGVSSRGVGSVTKKDDYMIVGEDFELICWDVVTMPSTIGSWMYSSEEDTKQHVDKKPHVKESNLEVKPVQEYNSNDAFYEKLRKMYSK